MQIAEDPRIAGAPQIAGGLKLMGPPDCSWPFRLLKAPQIAGGPSDCWGPLRWLGPLCIAVNLHNPLLVTPLKLLFYRPIYQFEPTKGACRYLNRYLTPIYFY